MSRLVIRNDEELFAATERAQELMGFTEGSAEEREMDEIANAIDQYAASLRMQSRAANDDTAPTSSYQLLLDNPVDRALVGFLADKETAPPNGQIRF